MYLLLLLSTGFLVDCDGVSLDALCGFVKSLLQRHRGRSTMGINIESATQLPVSSSRETNSSEAQKAMISDEISLFGISLLLVLFVIQQMPDRS